MTFLSAIFLTGLLATAVPVVLHLIHRQRYPERKFTTLRFFDVTIKHNVIQRRLIDKILLVLRVLGLLALMLGLARPLWNLPWGERRMSVVLVVDNSPSMGRKAGEATLLELAQREATNVLSQVEPGSRAALVTTSPISAPDFVMDRAALERRIRSRTGLPTGLITRDPDTDAEQLLLPNLLTDSLPLLQVLQRVPAGQPVALVGPGLASAPELTGDLGSIRRRLDQLRPGTEPGQMADAFASAHRLLSASADADKVIVVFTDLQRTDWHGVEGVDARGIHVRVVGLAPPAGPGMNLAIEECLPQDTPIRFGQALTVLARVRNHGPAALAGGANLLAQAGDQQRIIKMPVPALPPGSSTLVPFTVPAMARGSTLFLTVTLECPQDSFAPDNVRHCQWPLSPPIRVLCVHGSGGEDPETRSGFFVANALAPRRSTDATEGFADVTECPVDELANRELFEFNVVVLAEVDRLEEGARRKVRSFVEDGGGVLMFPAPRGLTQEYNAWGFLPARFIEEKEGEFVYVKSVAEEERVMADLTERAGGLVHSLSAHSWFQLEAEPEATVLMRLSNTAPAVVSRRQGKGRVVMVASGAHSLSGTDWPLRPVFVIAVRGLVEYLAGEETADDLAGQRGVGEGLAAVVPRAMGGGTPGAFQLDLRAGNYQYEARAWYRHGDRLLLAHLDKPGHYVLSVQPTAESGVLTQPGLGAALTPVSLNGAPAESRFDILDAENLARRIPAGDVALITPGVGAEISLAELSAGREIWRYLLLGALLLAGIETLVAWRTVSGAAG